ncbi:MAG TPA: TIGR04283 family arsenosugar biosynthesis glycosyltransferase [Pirellulales bacterium]|nr:TIGR04283 family arsenosugar biosynthesis glycosyltransferase [Pirellulales bacterium]
MWCGRLRRLARRDADTIVEDVRDSLVPVSIVIPALNEAAMIAASVTSALATGPHEVIVVDGGSRDDTASLARAAGAGVVVCPPGRAFQQNAGARAASGDVLLFLHADTRLAVDGLRQMEAALTDAAVGCGAFRQAIEAEGWLYRLLERGNAWRAARRGLPYGDQGIFVRRELFEEIGGFPRLKLMEDVFLMKRLRRRAWPVLLPGPLYVSARRWQRRGVIRQTLRNWGLLVSAGLGVHPDRLARFYT